MTSTMKRAVEAGARAMSPDTFGTACEVRIIESPFALKATEIRNFPVSRHRSARVQKKLVRRFGGEFRLAPAMFKLPDGSILAHPVMALSLRARIQQMAEAE